MSQELHVCPVRVEELKVIIGELRQLDMPPEEKDGYLSGTLMPEIYDYELMTLSVTLMLVDWYRKIKSSLDNEKIADFEYIYPRLFRMYFGEANRVRYEPVDLSPMRLGGYLLTKEEVQLLSSVSKETG